MDVIPFNQPIYTEKSEKYIIEAMHSHKISGDGVYTRKCSDFLEKRTGSRKVFLTTSCTHATEMAALLANIQSGDEVIMASFTFVSTANAFVLRGARVVFVDIRPDTMNLDENKIEEAITDKTKAIIPMHYAGVSCEMDSILSLARGYGLTVIEDAAQGVMSTYKGNVLGTLGNFGCYSFHETKNFSMGEGGALLIRDAENIERAEIIREKGTNRSKFFRGEIDKYTWVDAGSSYLPSDLNAAYLWGQLEEAEKITEDRLDSWNSYFDGLKGLRDSGMIELPYVPEECGHNGHIFYLKARDLEERTRLIAYLKERGIGAVFHYVPLHTAPAGKNFGRFVGEDRYTTRESDRLLRLPLYYQMGDRKFKVIEAVNDFYKKL
ncbi:MAG: dTDP-4-amino-4,6-dideoxygalactose transaminase [Lachnospiraceae bacterium]|nr:dTDP-4-amino-4,6-dideoxygalactose transaminase [Lachnospiraceae bacterium]